MRLARMFFSHIATLVFSTTKQVPTFGFFRNQRMCVTYA
jgi:hypothetical protein